MSDFGVNQGLVEEMFLRWAASPSSVADSWQRYFQNLPQTDWPQLTSAGSIAAPPEHVPPPKKPNGATGVKRLVGELDESLPSAMLPLEAEHVPFVDRRSKTLPPSDAVRAATQLQGRVSALINAYRVRGHNYADLDPLGLRSKPLDNDLVLERYGLTEVAMDTVFSTGDMAGPPTATLGEIIARLNETYTRTIGAEFTFLEDREARFWLQNKMESTNNRLEIDSEMQIRVLSKLIDAETFEQFLHTKYIGAKRFSLEGAESVIPMLDLLADTASEGGVEEIVIGMAHRGRLNVMVNILKMDIREIFSSFEDRNGEAMVGTGDVKYHLGYSVDRQTSAGRNLHMTLTFNPSHLEFVNPVVEGRVRAKQDRRGDELRRQVMPILIHGDAAFAGQGIVPETLNLSELGAYTTGGTIHVVINNQIGFTTIPQDSRSTRYCTDIARMLRVPVFHVNGEDPEAVVQVVQLATEFRQRFGRDVVIDLYTYRKYGHNEGDEPRFTQPVMYAAVDEKKTIREIYEDSLVGTGRITREDSARILEKRHQELEAALEETRKGDYKLLPDSMGGLWSVYCGGSDAECPTPDTGVDKAKLVSLIDSLTTVPDWFTPHPRIERFVLNKQKKIAETGEGIDWGTAENLAFASMLTEGIPCRLTGQDARRGTFSHRHAVIYDVTTGRRYTRVGHLTPDQAPLEIYDSPLSEAGVLGYEWGYSLDSPDAFVAWEAQFGDFVNGAQVIIDQFISSSEDKWDRLSGLVMLLPHGFEGQGPEHSSARLERFLEMCAEDNMQVVNLTTPAQIFHCLRRQVIRKFRKPLIVMTPKSLLRHRRAVSTLDELATGSFQRVIPDALIEPSKITRHILCTGKIYYDLLEAREKRGLSHIALTRVEQLYPFDAGELQAAVARYPGAELVWAQEEPWNMGAWYFVHARYQQAIGRPIRCVSRPESASPATGSKAAHKIEQKRLMDAALG